MTPADRIARLQRQLAGLTITHPHLIDEDMYRALDELVRANNASYSKQEYDHLANLLQDCQSELVQVTSERDALRNRLKSPAHAHLDGEHLRDGAVDGCLLCEAVSVRKSIEAERDVLRAKLDSFQCAHAEIAKLRAKQDEIDRPQGWRTVSDLRIPGDGLPTILRIVPGTAHIGAQLTISHSAGCTSVYNLTPERCDALAEMLQNEADRMRRVLAEDQRIRDAIAA